MELRHGGRHIFGSGPCSRFHSTKNRIQNSDSFSHALPSLSLSLSLSLPVLGLHRCNSAKRSSVTGTRGAACIINRMRGSPLHNYMVTIIDCFSVFRVERGGRRNCVMVFPVCG